MNTNASVHWRFGPCPQVFPSEVGASWRSHSRSRWPACCGRPARPRPSTSLSQQVQGSAASTQEREWFNTPFQTGERFFGKVRGRVRFVTDTTAQLSSTRELASTDRGTMDAGQSMNVRVRNDAVASRLRVTARPALQMIFEYQPQDDPYVCNNNVFPTFSGDDWYMRTDGGGNVDDGMCGAFEITADDINRILQTTGIDLDMPEVFEVMDKFFTAGYGGTQTLSDSQQLLEIKVCKIISDTFIPRLGDHCDLQLNAESEAPLTTLGQTATVQACSDGQINGNNIPCLLGLGGEQTVSWGAPFHSYSVKAPCATSTRDVDVRVTDPRWSARLESLAIGLSLDFNVHLTANGDGADLINLQLPGDIALLTSPMALNVSYPNVGPLHVGDVTPDDDPPFVFLAPADVTINEGSSTTFTPVMTDLCTPTNQLSSTWSIDGTTVTGPTLTRSYNNDKPTAVHNGSLVVRDSRNNAAPAQPIRVTVRNVPPSVQLGGLPANPVQVGTPLTLTTQVSDPGADLLRWDWSFGNGTNVSRQATSVQDRSDTRTHTYTTPGEYTLQIGVNDGTDVQSVGGKVVAFDPHDKLDRSGTFIADSTSLGVPVGSSYTMDADIEYAPNAVRPSGPFVADYLIDIGSGETVNGHLVATSYEWVFDTAGSKSAQGAATVNGEAGWKFRLEDKRNAFGKRAITVTAWRPGVTTFASPDYRFGGTKAKKKDLAVRHRRGLTAGLGGPRPPAGSFVRSQRVRRAARTFSSLCLCRSAGGDVGAHGGRCRGVVRDRAGRAS